MNHIPDSFEGSVSDVMRSIDQCSGDWKLAVGPETGILSLSVFGTAGNRYSILVIEKEHLRTDHAGQDGKWLLVERKEDAILLNFDLEWAVEATGSGCLVLCGRETPAPFSSSA